MAATNEQIGIAKAAYNPTLSITAVAGLERNSFLNWFTWPSRFWAVGGSLSETLFDAGRRGATTETALAGYDATVADYRQTVLNAFQQVQDNLVALHVLNTESEQQHVATASAEESLQLRKIAMSVESTLIYKSLSGKRLPLRTSGMTFGGGDFRQTCF